MIQKQIRCQTCNKLLFVTDIQDGIIETVCSRGNCKTKNSLQCVNGICKLVRINYHESILINIKKVV